MLGGAWWQGPGGQAEVGSGGGWWQGPGRRAEVGCGMHGGRGRREGGRACVYCAAGCAGEHRQVSVLPSAAHERPAPHALNLQLRSSAVVIACRNFPCPTASPPTSMEPALPSSPPPSLFTHTYTNTPRLQQPDIVTNFLYIRKETAHRLCAGFPAKHTPPAATRRGDQLAGHPGGDHGALRQHAARPGRPAGRAAAGAGQGAGGGAQARHPVSG